MELGIRQGVTVLPGDNNKLFKVNLVLHANMFQLPTLAIVAAVVAVHSVSKPQHSHVQPCSQTRSCVVSKTVALLQHCRINDITVTLCGKWNGGDLPYSCVKTEPNQKQLLWSDPLTPLPLASACNTAVIEFVSQCV